MKGYPHLRIESTSGILVTGNGTDGPMFGFPDIMSAVPTIMRGGFRVTGSIGEAAGIGLKDTGVTKKLNLNRGKQGVGPLPRFVSDAG
jgi:hypothetical protein